MSQPFKLYRLQQIDTQLDQARQRLAKIEIALREDAAVRSAQELLDAAESVRQQTQKELHRLENEVKAQSIKIQQNEAALYGGKVRNPKELQDLEKESALLKKSISSLEDEQLEKMIALEEAEAACQSAAQGLQAAQDEKASRDALLRAEKASLQRDTERQAVEREAAASSISPEDLRIYEQLRQSRNGLAVSKVTDGSCAACGSSLTPALVQAAHSSSQLARCTFCGRILYAG